MSEQSIESDRSNRLKILTRQAQELSAPYDRDQQADYVSAMLENLNEGSFFPISYLEKMLSMQKNKLSDLIDGDNSEIVKLMLGMDQTKCKTTDGIEIEVENLVNVSQNVFETDEENEAAAAKLVQWLNSHGYGDIVKGRYFLQELDVSEELIEELKSEGVEVFKDAKVNTNSLKSLLKDHIKPRFNADLGFDVIGELPPADALKVSIFKRAKIKYPKVKIL